MVSVADAYHRAAPTFARAADPFVYDTLAKLLVAAIDAQLGPRSGPVLDVAAGSGAFGRRFRGVVAVDIAAGQLAVNGAPIRVRADAEVLPFRNDSFAAAGCSFGINHLLNPVAAVREMARVAPIVGLSTWQRPERSYAPKRAVHDALERQVGHARSEVGEMLDRLGDQVGSVEAVTDLLTSAALDSHVEAVEAEIPWPGLDRFIDYRLGIPTSAIATDRQSLREEVRRSLAGASSDELTWRPIIIIGVGRRGAGS